MSCTRKQERSTAHFQLSSPPAPPAEFGRCELIAWKERGPHAPFRAGKMAIDVTFFYSGLRGLRGASAMAAALACRASLCCVRCSAGEADYYSVLQVQRAATPAQLKTAYRRLAREHHPDVSQHPDAQRRFVELSTAYEVLIDEEARAIYDVHGAAGLKGGARNSKGAAWDVWDTWDEFKPFQRKSRKGDARSSSAARSDADASSPDGHSQIEREAEVGDVVEYPLSDAARAQHQDGRIKGVGLLVGRNKDRGDRDKLPLECLDLVEIEPLYTEVGSSEWRADPMEGAAFSSLPSLRVLRSEYKHSTDYWTIYDDLSPGCGSPEYAEEVIL